MGRTHLRRSMALAACLVALLALPAAALAHDPGATGSAGPVVADLAGHPLAVAQIPAWYCHDLDAPRIHCFTSLPALEHAVASRSTAGAIGPSATATAYVEVFTDANWQGAALMISAPYPDLRTINWNDKISSFKALNGLAGHFATDIYDSGRLDYFCCNQQVLYVGDTWNDQLSSAYPG